MELKTAPRAIDYLNTRERLYVIDGYAGWDTTYQLKIRVVCARAYHALFMHNMLIRPTRDELRGWFLDLAREDNAETRSFFVQGWSGGSFTVDRIQRGTLDQLMASPITRLELILGKLLPFFGISLFNVATILFVTDRWFGIPVVERLPLLLLLCALFVLTSLATGLLISAVSRSGERSIASRLSAPASSAPARSPARSRPPASPRSLPARSACGLPPDRSPPPRPLPPW